MPGFSALQRGPGGDRYRTPYGRPEERFRIPGLLRSLNLKDGESGGEPMSSMESQELEVEQANDRFYRAFESLDIRRMEEVWARDESVRCIHPGWGVRSGWPAVRDSWVLIFNSTNGIRFEITDLEIGVKGDLAWVICVERVQMRLDGEAQESRVLATNLYSKGPTGWMMIHHHGSPVMERPGG